MFGCNPIINDSTINIKRNSHFENLKEQGIHLNQIFAEVSEAKKENLTRKGYFINPTTDEGTSETTKKTIVL